MFKEGSGKKSERMSEKTENPKGVELLEACKARDMEKVKHLVEDQKVPANYERYVSGTWGAHTRESPVHHALKQVQLFSYFVK